MAKFVWIASYPRSGNSWVRYMLATLLYGEIASSAELNRRVPGIHGLVPGAALYGNRKTLLKTHWAWRPDLPLREDTIGAIYILRHPFDSIISNFHYERRGGARADIETERQSWLDGYLEADGIGWQRELGFGGWAENVESWTASPLPYPRLILRYEDIKKDAALELNRMARFLGFEPEPARLRLALEKGAFEAMRAMEEREIEQGQIGIFYDPGKGLTGQSDGRFVRQGASAGDGGGELSESWKQRFVDRYGATMKRFDYL